MRSSGAGRPSFARIGRLSHGPGSAHVAWAEAGAPSADPSQGLTVLLRDRGQELWAFPEGARIAQRMTPLPSHTETEVCAQIGRAHV